MMIMVDCGGLINDECGYVFNMLLVREGYCELV